MKKTLKILLPVLTIGMLTGCQISANNSSKNGGTNNNGSNPSTQSEQVYAFEAITSAGLLHSLNNNQDVLAVKKAKADETLVNQIKDYLPSVEAALTNQSLMTSSEVVASDRNEYATKVIITFTDIAFINQTMTMYYNETAIPDDDFDDDWDDQFEEEYVIDGLIIIDDVEYQMFGKNAPVYNSNVADLSTRLIFSSSSDIVEINSLPIARNDYPTITFINFTQIASKSNFFIILQQRFKSNGNNV